MRTISFNSYRDARRGSTLSLTFGGQYIHDLGVLPVACMTLFRQEHSAAGTERLLTIWPTGIQLGKHVLRLGYLCEGPNAVDDKTTTLWHMGPRGKALEYFHGAFGPKWPVKLDGDIGYFTVGREVKETNGEDGPWEEVVQFVRGPVPASMFACPECRAVVYTLIDHLAECKLVTKLLFDLGIQLRPEAPSGVPVARETWGNRHGVTFWQAVALTRTEPDNEARLQGDMLVVWGHETDSDIEEWKARSERLGLQWPLFGEKVGRAAYNKGGPMHRETYTPAPSSVLNTAAPTSASPGAHGEQARARLKVRLTTYFGAGGYGDWLAERYPGRRLVEALTTSEAEFASTALTEWCRGRERINGVPCKYTDDQLDDMTAQELSMLYASEFPGHAEASREHATMALLKVTVRKSTGRRPPTAK